ncbi:OB-fold domain-containing protein [Candidatus Woesebacteria bacterium]|nr:OB-fold domain-containing protein [Candidatus Woesebacteria bacterium]
MRTELTPRVFKEEAYRFSGRGRVYSFTTVYEAPEGFKEFEPYVVALVRLEEGPLVTAGLTDLEQEWVPKEIDGEIRSVMRYKVKIGMPVEEVTRKLRIAGDPRRGLIIYGSKFRPLLLQQQVEPVSG